jgi:hypothetical protein
MAATERKSGTAGVPEAPVPERAPGKEGRAMGPCSDMADIGRFLRSPEGEAHLAELRRMLEGRTVVKVEFANRVHFVETVLRLEDGGSVFVAQAPLVAEAIRERFAAVLERERRRELAARTRLGGTADAARLERTRFAGAGGAASWGWRLRDGCCGSYTDGLAEAEVPSAPLELLATAAATAASEGRDEALWVLGDVLAEGQGMWIDGAWFEAGQVAPVLERALGKRGG